MKSRLRTLLRSLAAARVRHLSRSKRLHRRPNFCARITITHAGGRLTTAGGRFLKQITQKYENTQRGSALCCRYYVYINTEFV